MMPLFTSCPINLEVSASVHNSSLWHHRSPQDGAYSKQSTGLGPQMPPRRRSAWGGGGGAGVWLSPWWPGGCLLLNHPCGLQPGGWISASDESLTALQTSSWKVLLLTRNYSAFPCWQCWALIRPCPQALEGGLWGKKLAMDWGSFAGCWALAPDSSPPRCLWGQLSSESPGKIVFCFHFLPWFSGKMYVVISNF